MSRSGWSTRALRVILQTDTMRMMPLPEPSQPTALKRDELYEAVWAEPVRTVAKRYGISDVALAKACRKLDIPLPRRGHWARVASGQKVKRRALPPLTAGAKSEYRLNHRVQANSVISPEVAAAMEKELAPERCIEVMAKLEEPHQFVAKAAIVLGKAKPNREGLVYRTDLRCLDIQVSPGLLDRSLRLMDALLKALEQREYEVDVTLPRREEKRDDSGRREFVEQPSRTVVEIGGHDIAFGVAEEVDYKAPKAKRPDLEDVTGYFAWRRMPMPQKTATGIRTLAMKGVRNVGRLSWSDERPKKLEKCLNSFVRGLIRAASALEGQRLAAKAQERKWQAWRRQRDREERERAALAERIERLDEHLDRWGISRDIRAFVEEARALLATSGTAADPATENYLTWALKRADDLNPLRWLRCGQAIVRIEDREEVGNDDDD